ncbi:FecR domain-containing protein [Geovibrio thiophilus]|nr:FecR domain-containing protein [Geovibrio thiophilus]
MKKILLLITVLAAITATAFSIDKVSIGEIASAEGKVNIYKENEVRGELFRKNNHRLFKGDRIKTSGKSKAFINFRDQSKVVVLEKSLLTIDDFKKYSPSEGKVVFKITKTNEAQGVQIGLQTTVIGVKGTTFLVEVEPNPDGIGAAPAKVYLKEGELEFTSVEGEFKRYVEQVQEEYNSFVNETMSDYERYLKEQNEEFVEYVKEFSIKGGAAISIDGNEVRNIEFDDNVTNAFKELDLFSSRINVQGQTQKKKTVRPPIPPRPQPKPDNQGK